MCCGGDIHYRLVASGIVLLPGVSELVSLFIDLHHDLYMCKFAPQQYGSSAFDNNIIIGKPDLYAEPNCVIPLIMKSSVNGKYIYTV
jgi:hypothetical protein